MTQYTLSVKELRKTIANKEIIKGISFDLERGEVFGFLGPNGAGKTTTIRMIVGLIRPTSGSIEVCGYNIRTDFIKAMSQLGCIVENPELYPYLSGRDNLEHFARMIPGISKDRVEQVTDLVGLQHRIDDLVKTYSLGMRQRLGIAQALLGNPSVLILDEPTNGLDPAGIREMRSFIRTLAEQNGLTVLVSSHLLSEVQAMCDTVGIVSKGVMIKTGKVEELLTRQEKIVWSLNPMQKGTEMLRSWTDTVVCGETIETPYVDDVHKWNRWLVEAGVEVNEMRRKLPTLEDLFLELTGGESID